MQPIMAAFDAGELDPSLHANVDTELFQRGAKTLRNMLNGTPAGVESRPGTEWLKDIYSTGTIPGAFTDPVLVPFIYSETQRYCLVFTYDGDMYVLKEDGTFVQSGGSDYVLATGLTNMWAGYGFTQVADSIWITKGGSWAYKIVRIADDNWTVAAATTAVPISEYTQPNSQPSPYFNSYHRAVSANEIYTGAYIVDQVCPDGYTRRHYTGNSHWIVGAYGTNDVQYAIMNAIPDSVWTQSTADANCYYLNTEMYTDADVIANIIALYAYEIPTTSGESTLRQIDRTASDALPTSDWQWCFNDHDTLGFETFYVRVNGGVNPSNITADVDYFSYTFAGSQYNIYMSKVDGEGTVGFVGSTVLPVVEFPTEPVPDIGLKPYFTYEPFSVAASQSPETVCAAFQRLWWGGASNKPATVEGSSLGDLALHGRHVPPLASDGIEIAIADEEVNKVLWIVRFTTGVLVFTSGALFLVSGTTGGIQTTGVQWLCDTEVSDVVQPIVIGSTVIWCDAYNKVMELTYSDERKAYYPIDRTQFHRHLFPVAYTYNNETGKLRSWAYSKPSNTLFLVKSNGELLTSKLIIGGQIWPWTRHDTGAWSAAGHDTDSADTFKSVCCIGSEVIFACRRSVVNAVAGSIRIERLRYIEYEDITPTASNGWFLDCAKYYTGGGLRVITGLDHLEGYSVMALADGNELGPFTVASGTITLDDTEEYEDVLVGIPFAADIMTLRIGNLGAQMQGKRKNVSGADVVLRDTRDIDAGPDFDNLTAQNFRDREAYNVATELFTGVKHISFKPGWSNTGEFVIRQGGPYPLRIDAIMPEVRLADQR